MECESHLRFLFDFFGCTMVSSGTPQKTYWIVVIFNDHWQSTKHKVIHICGKWQTKHVIVSQPVFSPYYNRVVNYALFTFRRTVTKHIFGQMFCLFHDVVPVMHGAIWIKEKHNQFIELIKQLGEPLYEYNSLVSWLFCSCFFALQC